MARKVTVELVDDLDPTMRADDTITFSIDGRHYEIDLCAANINKMRESLGPWVAAARTGMPKRKRQRQTINHVESATRNMPIRQWAAENGITVSAKGRIPFSVMEAYWARHPASTAQDSEASEAPNSRVEIALGKAAKKVGAEKVVDVPAFSSK